MQGLSSKDTTSKGHLIESAVYFLLFAVYLCLPFLVGLPNAPLRIHDSADSELMYRILLARTSGDTLPMVMNGLPRDAVNVPPIHVITLAFVWLPPIWANAFITLLTRLLGFLSCLAMFRMLTPNLPKPIPIALAITWAILPFYPIHGLSVIGLPALIWAYFHAEKPNWKSFAVMFVFPFFSQFVLGGFAAVGVGLLFGMGQVLRGNPLGKRRIGLSLTLLAGYLVSEFRFFRWMLASPFVSHRAEWNLAYQHHDAGRILPEMLQLMFVGEYHAPSLPLIIAILAGFMIWIQFKIRTAWRNWWLAIGLLTLFSLLHSLWFWQGLIPIKAALGFLKTFNAGRISFLNPVLWYIVLGLGLASVQQNLHHRWVPHLLRVAVWLNLGWVMVMQQEIRLALQPRFYEAEYPSWQAYFADGLWDKVDRAIGLPKSQYRTISIGLHPAIAQYHGFYTLDSYQNNYPLTYKHRFRAIISRELAVSPKWQPYFDDWGNRCYVFSHDLSRTRHPFWITKDQQLVLKDFRMDAKAFRYMGGRFVFSAVEIPSSGAIGLTFRGQFSEADVPYQIFLYEASGSK